MRSLFPRLRALVFRSSVERELDEELAFHIEMQTRKNRALGMEPEQALHRARVDFGADTGAVKEYCRDVLGIVWLEQLRQDIRYACRGLVRSPGFTLLAVFALALGIGVNTTLVTAYNGVALKPLPVADPGQVVRLERCLASKSQGNFQYGFSYPVYVYCRDRSDQFSSLVAASWTFSALASTPGSAATQQRTGQLVSANYFADLGIPLQIGRGFLPQENRTPGANPVVVIGYAFWQRTFAGDPTILGRTIDLNGAVFTIIGVTPEHFTGTTVEVVVPDFWAPLSMQAQLVPGQDWLNRPDQRHFQIFARLKPSSARSTAQAQADLLVRQFAATWTPRDRTTAVTLQRTTYFPNTDDIRFRALMMAVMLMVGLVLLVACANVGNMLLARGATRQREISTRLALGAGRLRVLRQLLSESILLALLGGFVGLLLSLWTTRLLGLALDRNAALIGVDFSTVDLAPDFRVLVYVFVVALASGIFFGLSPALQFIPERPYRGSERLWRIPQQNLGGSKLRSLLVAAQVAVSVLLLATAGLLARGLLRSRAAEPGFETRRVFTVAADFDNLGSDPVNGIARRKRLAEKLRERPELSAVALGSRPFAGTWTPPIVVGSSLGRTLASYAANDYFETLQIPLLRGRLFTAREAGSNVPFAVISESAARLFWPGGDALGRNFALDMNFNGSLQTFEVIGIVKDVRFANLTRPDPAHVYLPPGSGVPGWVELLVRVPGDRQRALAGVETVVAASDQKLLPGLRLINLEDGAVRLQRSMSNAFAAMAAILAMLALALAAVGIYGVIAYLVSQRTREIGVRMALGADSAALWKRVLLQGLRPVFAGMALGGAVAACLSGILHQTLVFPGSMDFLYGVPFYDPLTFASLAAFVLVVATIAGAIPSRRALRVDPAVALRYE